MVSWMRWAGARLLRDARGGVAAAMALAMPVLLLAAGGAVELQSLQSDRVALQSIADASALWGARQLATNPVGVETQTRRFAAPQLARFGGRAGVQMSVAVTSSQTLTVALDATRPTLLGALLARGGYHTHVQSTAQALNTLPLCVQVFGVQPVDQLLLADGATATANNCLVHARGAINVEAAGDLSAGAVETESSNADGRISPQALTGALPLPDPFANLPINFPEPCAANAGAPIVVSAAKPVTLAPKVGATWLVVQSPIQFDGTGGALTLAPGEYYFCQSLNVAGGALAIQQQALLGASSNHGYLATRGVLRGAVLNLANPPAADSGSVVGDDVVLIFADGAKLNLAQGSSVTLNGRKSGPLAGFVLIAGLSQPNGVFTLDFDQIQSLQGAVYVRQGLLDGQGVYKSTSAAAWTAVVANQFTLHRTPAPPSSPSFGVALAAAAPAFAFNADFAASDVPRPAGIGDNAQLALARVRLIK